MHIHLLYDPTRLDLSFESIAQSIEFIGRFGDKQRQLGKKCQLVSSTHLTHSIELLEARAVGWRGASADPLAESLAEPALIYAVNRRGRNSRHRLQSTASRWVYRDLPLPIPGEGRDPVTQPLPHWRRRLSHHLEGPNRLRRLTP